MPRSFWSRISTGGAFSRATIGTHYLLTPSERKLLAGFLINKFRGDPALFKEGVEIIEKRTKKPVFGVLPMMMDLAIPQEDSVALDRKRPLPGGNETEEDNRIRIGVVRLARISNYTDFDALEQEPSVALHYLEKGDPLDGFDLVILPGTKNTIGDLLRLKQDGTFGRLKDYAEKDGRIVGICGGYQMLGLKARDPKGIEGAPGEEEAMGLLPVVTTMEEVKTTTQVTAKATGIPAVFGDLTGYEIHMGSTETDGSDETDGGPAVEITSRNGMPVSVKDGWVGRNGRIWGTYIHGIFDNDAFRRAIIRELLKEKGFDGSEIEEWSYGAFQEEQFDMLADRVLEHVDMDRIWKLIRM